MTRVLLVLFFATRVNLQVIQPQSYQHEYYVTKQMRDNSQPVQTGYVFSRKNNNPAIFETFGDRPNVQVGDGDGTPTGYSAIPMENSPSVTLGAISSGRSESLVEQYPGLTAMHKHLPLPSFDMHSTPSFGTSAFTSVTESTMPYTTKSWTEHSINYEIAKAKSKFSVDPLSAIKTKSDIMQNRMKSLMHFNRSPRTLEDKTPRYDYTREFHVDADDVKTSSRNEYEWWPYFLHHPYEYENIKMDSDIQKAKEKRYAVESAERVIPVHESHEDYSDGYGAHHSVPRHHRAMRNDNPIAGDEPFLSFVLNDYFDKNADDDPLEFKGLEWGTDFDMNKHKEHNYGKRDSAYNAPGNYADNEDHIGAQNFNAVSKSLAESATEKGYDNKHHFDKYEKADTRKENNKADHKNSEDKRTHFKDFVDQFANKFGGEDHKRHSNFALKTNKDNAEKRKGFRRVYHKDEYQEDNEFFDNTGNSVKAEESGSSTTHLGGSEAALQSHAAATEGTTANSFNKAGNSENNKYESSHIGNDNKHGIDRDFNKYIDVAKKTAHSNIADYYDKFAV